RLRRNREPGPGPSELFPFSPPCAGRTLQHEKACSPRIGGAGFFPSGRPVQSAKKRMYHGGIFEHNRTPGRSSCHSGNTAVLPQEDESASPLDKMFTVPLLERHPLWKMCLLLTRPGASDARRACRLAVSAARIA